MLRNVASQKLTVFAFDYSTGAPKTGDSANLTAYVQKDDGTVTALTDTSATEIDSTNAKGLYTFDLAQGETDAVKLVFSAKSSTANVAIVPQTIYTAPANFTSFALDSSGRVTVGSIVNGAIAAATFAANALDAVWSTATRVLTAGTNIALAKGTGITGFNDLDAAGVASATQTGLTAQGYTTTRAGYLDTLNGLVQAIWDKATSALTTVGSIGKLIVDNLDAAISTRSTYAGGDTAGTTTLLSRLTSGRAGNLDNLDAAVSTRLASASYTAPPTAADNADAVWEETLADHSGTSGSTAAALNAAGSAGDPWNTALPGSYGAGTAGKIVGDNLNATVSSRLASASYTAPDNAGIAAAAQESTLLTVAGYVDTEVAAIKAKTDNLPASPAATGDIPSAATIASQVRTELTTELGRIDVAVSTRLASAGYTAPDNATIASIYAAVDTEIATLLTNLAAVKTKTDNLPTDPADQSQVEAAITAAVAALALEATAQSILTRLGVPTGLSVSADIAAVQTAATAVKTQTDKLTFDASNNVAANAKAINDKALTGDGSVGTPWGPA